MRGCRLGAGLPFLIISFLAFFILLIWAKKGKGASKIRNVIAASFITTIAVCWILLAKFGVFHSVGGNAMLVGFIVSIVALFVPSLVNRLLDHH